MSESIKIFLADKFGSEGILPLARLGYSLVDPLNANLFYRYDNSGFNYHGFKFIDRLEECDLILLPQGVRHYAGQTKSYIDHWLTLAGKSNKKVLIFLAGDLQHNVYVSRTEAIVFKSLNYRFLKRNNEIYIPVYVDDLLAGKDLNFRSKGGKPVVGFCGWAEAPGLVPQIKLQSKNLGWEWLSRLTGREYYRAYKKGIWYRKCAINLLQADPRIETNFIVRTSYSGNAKTISLDPSQARQEFIDNIISSDFVLTPKGDGNSSARFYEALSLGRIPILIDTEMILPLEGVIDYSSFTLRVSYRDLHRLPEIVANFWQQLDPEEFVAMQRRAREAFVKYLRYDSFFSYVFENDILTRFSLDGLPTKRKLPNRRI